MGKADYLEEETVKLWKVVRVLEEESRAIKAETQVLKEAVEKKTSDYEADAREASDKAAEHEQKSKEASGVIAECLNEANLKLNEIRLASSSFSQLQPEITAFYDDTKNSNEMTKKLYAELNTSKTSIMAKITELEEIFAKHATYVEQMTKLEAIFTKSDDSSAKVQVLVNSLLSRKKEIDALYYDIIGTTEKDAAGVDVKVAGLKDELEEAYTELTSKADKLLQITSDIELNTERQYSTYRETKESEFAGILSNWKVEYSEISKKVFDLLPEALTKGLSFAYHEKKVAEITESKWLSAKFIIAIVCMVGVSLIPFALSYYSWRHDIPLDKVLLDMPRLVLAILPLYIPVLWLAYSANKSLKLSKRLIEEYTHKEVLSKTFEGLSKQIENIEDKDISSELRVKLLYNILEVNSENPGKLITDYNKSDHPLMDALDKSFKLANAVDKLAEIPGLSKLAAVLDKKAKRILKEKQDKADEGLEAISKGDKKEDED